MNGSTAIGSAGRTAARVLVSLGVVVGLSASIEAGFRWAESASDVAAPLPPKAPNELRIFAYGESIVEGAPRPAVGFVEQLRYNLRATYPRRSINVVNYGGRIDSSDVAAVAAETIHQSPDAIIVLTGGNEYLRRTFVAAWKRRIRISSAAVRMITSWLPPRGGADDPWPTQIVPYSRTDLGQRLGRFRENLTTILRMANARGIPVLLCTVASNLRDWPPVHHRLARPGGAATYERTIGEIEKLIDAGSSDAALAEIAQARSVYPGDAMLVYLEGRTEQGRKRYGEAQELLTRAKDLDPFPWRPLSVFNDAIRDSARGTDVHLIDLEQIFRDHSEGGSPGFDLMADNIHPNPVGNAIIAQALVKALRQIVPSGSVDTACCDPEAFLHAIGFYGSHLEVEYLLASGKYAMKTPFYAFRVSRGYLNKAVAIAPSNWQVWANLATLSLFEGHVRQGQSELREAIRLKGSDIDPRDRAATPYLQEALREHD